MKYVLTSALLILHIVAVAQVSFTTTYYNSKGKIWRTEDRSVDVTSTMDLNFYQSHFYEPRHYPKKFVNTNYKLETIEIWNDTTKTKSLEENWKYTYQYDSLSRVTLYSYSGCLKCNMLPYSIKIDYDNLQRPSVFHVGQSENGPKTDKYEFTYDNLNNIISIRYLRSGKIIEEIVKK